MFVGCCCLMCAVCRLLVVGWCGVIDALRFVCLSFVSRTLCFVCGGCGLSVGCCLLVVRIVPCVPCVVCCALCVVSRVLFSLSSSSSSSFYKKSRCVLRVAC